MAQKLPPPANTKTVFAGTAWFDTDKVLFAPAIVALANRHATFGRGYSSGRAGCTINIGCGDTIVIPGWSEGPDPESGNYHLEIPGSRSRAPRNDGLETQRPTVPRTPSRSRNDRAGCYCLRQNRALRTSGAALPAWPGCRTS